MTNDDFYKEKFYNKEFDNLETEKENAYGRLTDEEDFEDEKDNENEDEFEKINGVD